MANEINVPASIPEVQIQVDVQDSVSAKEAEAWARGSRAGVPVGASDPTHNNNAKYYAEQMQEILEEVNRQAVQEAAREARASATAASGSAGAAAESEESAADSAEDAEAYAVGKRGCVDVPSTDPTYHNNAKYYREMAQEDANKAAGSLAGAQAAAQQASGYAGAAEDAQSAAEAAAQEAIETVVAAQGPGILYVDSEGIPYVLE